MPKAVSVDKCFYSFTDSSGYEVVLAHKPKKVAVLFSSYTEIWNISGGKADITVAESVERGFCDEVILVDDKSGHTVINTELLLASKPDLVIGTLDHEAQVEAVELCRNAGIPSALFRVEGFGDYLKMLKICCDINENEDNYSKYGTDIEKEINDLLNRIPDKETDILFVRCGSAARSTKAKTAENNFVCAMLNELGTYNIAENVPILLDGLSIEEIIKADPEHIFVTTMGDEDAAKEYFNSLLISDGWSSLNAVKEGNVHFLPKDSFHYKPNHRWYEAYRYLYDIIYG
ncbi:MAG: ABC transporter substrate-binding protein [Clostridia bacterium]|nr:ABC transporter substrate-binding protein [Clostridia bacterium]